ncbi:hypothetical protein GA0070607_4606 [Micromonospora coriariae]|uniref:Uncharacterized protein n=1 Tax=Micromonospora coriariae TaxID=285665 RepID=A0A1C4X379_9ACTN|nr:hypothetical protein [Micromonospora coriariae]SCF02886.1 hypothetical protein GA0070607_4606 [Micromonospora coriariae]
MSNPSAAIGSQAQRAEATDEFAEPDPGALLLAHVRAIGHVNGPVAASTLGRAMTAAAGADRCLGELIDAHGRTILIRGWLNGAAPNPDLHPSGPPRTLPPVANLVWAACLGEAWPDPAASPYPGRPFSRASIIATCAALDADSRSIVTALDTTLPTARLITLNGDRGELGPAAAALPSATWSQLRRIHERLPRPTEHRQPPKTAPDETFESSAVRWIATDSQAPATDFDDNIRRVICALEAAEGPIRHADLPMLMDPAIRSSVEITLSRCGRTLVSVGSHSWITGYPSAVAATLARHQVGTLQPMERAVLALVLLHTVAIPRARGIQLDDTWASTHPVQMDTLIANRTVKRTTAVAALRGLRRAGFVATARAGGYLPGPALLRLTPNQRNLLWEDLIVLGRPNGYMARRIREQRATDA